MEDVIRKYFQCWLDKDINDVKEIYIDDIICSECYGPVYKGIGQIIRWFEDWNRKSTVLQWDIKRVNEDMKICDLKEFQSKAEHYYLYGESQMI